ncbi:serine protease inhibitor Kazal-type 9-like [Notamacropus eugenii]|uniref:serine protease inhibitor Kazal-type 9-like n=1 Tax=Notamacropus eugenii TaxID=9315 RepID=UPI003B679FC8
MKVAAACVFLMLALMPIFNVESAYRKRVDCRYFKKLPAGKVVKCMQIYDPICGSDGITYSNTCFFCSAVRKSNKKIRFVRYGEC